MSRKICACITIRKFDIERMEFLYTHVTVESKDPALVKSRLQTLKKMGIIQGHVTGASYGPFSNTYYIGVI